MADILKHFNSNLYAIDFIPPRFWLNDPYTKSYGVAHKGVIADKKQRIHIIDIKEIKHSLKEKRNKIINDYMNYISFMTNDCDIDLYFLDKVKFDVSKHEPRGSLVLDCKCVFVAINPSIGAPFGEIDFNPSIIKQYKERFEFYLSKAEKSVTYKQILEELKL
jgi:hypothetical protein